MGGYGAHDAVASATRSHLSLKRHSMLTWTEKGERLDGEMHSIHLFSDAYTRQVEALTQKSPFRRFIQSTHTLLAASGGLKRKEGMRGDTPHPGKGLRLLHSYLLLLLNGRGQFKGWRRLAPAFGGLCFEAFDGFIRHIATAQRGWVNAGAVKVAAAGGDE